MDLDLGEGDTADIMKKVVDWVKQTVFGPDVYMEVTIVTSDNQVIQFTAEFNNPDQVMRILYAYVNASQLGLKVILSKVSKNARVFQTSANIEGIQDLIGRKFTDKAFEKVMDKIGLSDTDIITGIFHQLYPDKLNIGRIGNKIIGKALFLYDWYTTVSEMKDVMDKYSSEKARELARIGLCLTTDPNLILNDLAAIVDINSDQYGSLTYENLNNSSAFLLSTTYLSKYYSYSMGQIVGFGFEMVMAFF